MLKTILKWLSLASLTFFLTACATTDMTRSTGQDTGDAAITARVERAFINDEQLSTMDIEVKTFRSMVHLFGFANSRELSNRAYRIAHGVEGVKSVHNHIQLSSN